MNTKSYYSFMQGTAAIGNLCKQARIHGYKSIALAEKFNFHSPDFSIVMPPWSSHADSDHVLYEKTMAGAKKRYGLSLPGRVVKRIDHELAIISRKNFSEYFLVVEKIVQRASRICGRGSGAAFIRISPFENTAAP